MKVKELKQKQNCFSQAESENKENGIQMQMQRINMQSCEAAKTREGWEVLGTASPCRCWQKADRDADRDVWRWRRGGGGRRRRTKDGWLPRRVTSSDWAMEAKEKAEAKNRLMKTRSRKGYELPPVLLLEGNFLCLYQQQQEKSLIRLHFPLLKTDVSHYLRVWHLQNSYCSRNLSLTEGFKGCLDGLSLCPDWLNMQRIHSVHRKPEMLSPSVTLEVN